MKIDMELTEIVVKLPVPQVGSKIYDYFLDKNKLVLLDQNQYNQKIDYIITEEYLLKLGRGHFKLNKKQEKLLMAGEIIINKKGKISYINNNSGHYQPTEVEFLVFINELKNSYDFLLSNNFKHEVFYFENQCKLF